MQRAQHLRVEVFVFGCDITFVFVCFFVYDFVFVFIFVYVFVFVFVFVLVFFSWGTTGYQFRRRN